MVKGTFKSGLTAADLKTMGIKLSPPQFDSSLHFDVSVTGDRVEALQNREVFCNVVNFNLRAAGNFIPRLEYAELYSPMYAIQKKMQPADFKVRVFGFVRENRTAVVNWQLEDVATDIKKIWKGIVRQIQLVRAVKDFCITLVGLRDYKEAIITQGGVSVREVNPSTMESRKTAGLYFAGEVLDLDAVTGGFNLQIAWSTGYLAGISIPQ